MENDHIALINTEASFQCPAACVAPQSGDDSSLKLGLPIRRLLE